MILLMSLWLITTGALRKRPGMTLMFTGHLKLTMTAAFFTWREPRRVSKSLTVQYDKVLYLIEYNELSRRAIGKYIEVWHYPDGHKELRLNDAVLPYFKMLKKHQRLCICMP